MERYWKRIVVITFVGANVLIAYYNFVYMKAPAKVLHPVERPSPSPGPQRRTQPPITDSKKIESEPNPTPQQVVANPDSLIIRFDQGGQGLTPQAKDGLLQIFNSLNADRALKVKVDGHTDNTGNVDGNVILSIRRAKLVHDYLIHWGIPDERIVVQGYGGTRPIADNATKEGQAANRRVEVTLVRE